MSCNNAQQTTLLTLWDEATMTKYQVEEIYGDTIVVSGIVVESDPLKAAETLAGQPLLPRAAQEHWFRAVDE
ncbi:MAG: hypothetical protein E5W20_00935, partial [Mesorhizobium sp.]